MLKIKIYNYEFIYISKIDVVIDYRSILHPPSERYGMYHNEYCMDNYTVLLNYFSHNLNDFLFKNYLEPRFGTVFFYKL